MIHLTNDTKISLATQPADFRKGIDGLVALCQQSLQQDSSSGTLFVFINRAGTMIRILAYENNGYWLMTKRLSKGRYQGWPKAEQVLSSLQAYQLRQLLSGALIHQSSLAESSLKL
jgi:transposase